MCLKMRLVRNIMKCYRRANTKGIDGTWAGMFNGLVCDIFRAGVDTLPSMGWGATCGAQTLVLYASKFR